MIGSEHLAALSALWDEALALDEPERTRWLASLPEHHAALKPVLAAMLAGAQDSVDAHGRLTLPKLPDIMPEDDTAPRCDGDIVGPYRLVRPLGHGGMSTVWLAERSDGLVNRLVALKMPHAWVVNSHFRERVEREREILARLAHPGIARLYDAGVTHEGQPYLALEHVEGRPITEHCDAHGLDLRGRLALFLQVLDAVGYAHHRRIVHRDLKPSNILVADDGQVRLLDFGIAKLLEGTEADSHATQLGQPALTPSYASPEQIAGQPVGEASDVYSLGVLLYELLGGRRPYRLRAPSRAALEEAIRTADIELPSAGLSDAHAGRCGTTPRQLAKALRGDLDAIVLTALKKRPEHRYAGVEPFGEDIRRHLAGQPVQARAEGAWYRWGRFMLRHRVETGAVAAVLLTLAAGLVTALWQAGQAREQARLARHERRTAESALGFLEAVFQSNSIHQPAPVAARATTARQLLDQGARDIDTGLNDAPEVKLRMLRTLSHLYAGMGLWEESLQLARKREALARTLFPPGHAELLDAQLDHAEAASNPATPEEAAAALAEVGALLDRQDDRSSMRRGRWQRLQANLDFGADRDGAIARATDSVRVLRSHGPSCELLQALNLRSDLLLRADALPAARSMLDEALRLAPSLPACDAEMRPQLLAMMCWVEGEMGNASVAERHCKEALATELRLRGPETPAAIEHTVDLATRLMRSSRLRESIDVMQGVVPVAIRLAKSEDFGQVNILWFKLGEALVLHGRVRQGMEVMDNPSRLDGRVAERSDADGPLLERKAAALIELGRHAEAAELLDRAQAMFPSARNVPRLAFNTSVSLRVQLLLKEDRPEEATAALASFYLPADLAATIAPDALEFLVLTAQVQAARRHWTQAEAAAAEVVRRIAASEHPVHHDLWRQRVELLQGRLALHAGRPDQAADHFEQALRLSRALFDPASPAITQAQAQLADAQARLLRAPR